MKRTPRFASPVFVLAVCTATFLAGTAARAVSVEDGNIRFVAWAGAGSDEALLTGNVLLDETVGRVGRPNAFSHGLAEITNGKVRMLLESGGSGAHDLHANVRDHYTILGDTPGAPVSLTAYLHVDGELSTPALGSGIARGNANIGGDINSDGLSPPDPSPYIGNPFGTVNGTVFDAFLNPGQSQLFSTELSAPLVDLNVGDTFTLAYRLVLETFNYMRIDLTNTATVSFDLPPGITLQSQNGFGAAPVPLPGALLLLASAVGVFGWTARRRAAAGGRL